MRAIQIPTTNTGIERSAHDMGRWQIHGTEPVCMSTFLSHQIDGKELRDTYLEMEKPLLYGNRSSDQYSY